MSVTIDDVAKHAGVSTATVSRYLNHSPLIAKKSAEKVQRSMDALNYQPSFVARSLANHSTSTIAFVIDSTNTETYGNDYFLRIQYGMEAALGRQGYYLLIISISNDKTGEHNLRKLVMERRVEGIILPMALAKRSILAMLREAELPFVVIGKSQNRDYNWIDLDNEMGGRLATQKLIDSGSKRLAFVSSSLDKSFVKERLTGYSAALEQSGLRYDERLVFLGCMSAEDGAMSVTRILSEGLDVDGIVCTDNAVAFGVVRALQQANIAVPEQIQVITFDNTPISELSTPKLSAVDIDVFQLGRQAANILLSSIEDATNSVQNSLIQVAIVLRESTR